MPLKWLVVIIYENYKSMDVILYVYKEKHLIEIKCNSNNRIWQDCYNTSVKNIL